MLTAYLFDRSRGESVDDWAARAENLTSTDVLWIDLQGPSSDEWSEVCKVLNIAADPSPLRQARRPAAQVHLHDDYFHVTSVVAPDEDDAVEPASWVLEALAGDNWVVTVHEQDSPLVDDFQEIATGAGQMGALDAPSFLATLLERVILSYTDAFEDIEERLQDFDADVLRSHDGDLDARVDTLVAARQRVGDLRRALAPHRRVYTTLSHGEIDAVSTEASAERFMHLADQVSDALATARDAREAVVNSFDMLILRTENRTNEIVKVLTLTSILLLPGALLAAIMGMNVNLAGSDFATSGVFWGTIVAVVAIIGVTLGIARARRWI